MKWNTEGSRTDGTRTYTAWVLGHEARVVLVGEILGESWAITIDGTPPADGAVSFSHAADAMVAASDALRDAVRSDV